MIKVSLIGIGRIGGALALALSKKGYKIENLVTKHPEKTQEIASQIYPNPFILSPSALEKMNSSKIIFITTQDDKIAESVTHLSRTIKPGRIVFHTSGSLSSKILEPLKKKRCYVGSLHPLVAVSNAVLGSERFKDTFFCVEGDEEAVEIAKRIVEKLEGRFFSIPTELKSLYHAAAVMSAGHLVTLFQVAIRMLSRCGLTETQAQEILLPLAKSVFANLEKQTPAEALTGTFARAELDTMLNHLQAMTQTQLTDAKEIYLKLGLISLTMAEAEHPSLKEKIQAMRAEISKRTETKT